MLWRSSPRAARWRFAWWQARAARWRFAWWQARAGFDRRYNSHALRHSPVTNVYRATRDLFLAQRFARHPGLLKTVSHTHPADEELAEGIRDLSCCGQAWLPQPRARSVPSVARSAKA